MIKNLFVKLYRENKIRLNYDIIDHIDPIDPIKQLDLFIIFIYNLIMYFSI